MPGPRSRFDVIVIGGGPSGLMAAASAAMHGAGVLLLEKGEKLGRKLAISGGGRCNVTNAGDIEWIIDNIPGNGRFLYSALTTFGNKDIIRFFENLGIRLKQEDNGRMFPASDRAGDVVQALVRKVRESGAVIRTGAPVDRVRYRDGRVIGVVLRSGEEIGASAVVVASGGMSVPQTGSTGDGYAWAREAGHTITELYPTEVPITSDDPFIRNRTLQGLSLRGVRLAVWNGKGKKIVEHEGDMIFTHFGLSGPIALRCSQFVVKVRKQEGTTPVRLTLDLFPNRSVDELEADLRRLAADHPRRTVKNLLKDRIPERLVPVVLEQAGIFPEITPSHMEKGAWQALARTCKAFVIHATGTLSLREAFVTGGGVSVKEIDPRTMASKKMKGLYFCGEILDVHGYTGGFNITAALSTGYVAGMSAARNVTLSHSGA
ncbi:MAG: NAD(P)/FAD-dependent oxidoreductase [Alicyclobacillaceae bacterium]|nr:NAD(P)/FAD-dependent oxidoreductase [Alicyclobacillaceae bacterium]